MKKYGDKKHSHGKVADHQNCVICRPSVKNAKTKARREGKQQAFLEFAKRLGLVPSGMLAVGDDWKDYLNEGTETSKHPATQNRTRTKDSKNI
jgi:hypothetical protein